MNVIRHSTWVFLPLALGLTACGGSSSDGQAMAVGSDDAMSPSAAPAPEPVAAADDDTTQPAPDGTGDSANCDVVASGPEAGPGAFALDYETSSDFFTRIGQPLPSRIHANQRTWYSSNVESYAQDGPFTAPPGTVAIKAEYDADGNNFITVVMVKQQAGYDPENGDWCYEAREPDGTVAADPVPGPASLCIGCHQGAASTDYLLGFALSN
jgi:hypothetical protein